MDLSEGNPSNTMSFQERYALIWEGINELVFSEGKIEPGLTIAFE